MLIKKSQAIKKQISGNGFVFEYPDINKNIGMAVSELNGRVPESGWMKNEVCLEVYYVLSGSAKIFIDEKKFDIEEGDILYIEAGKKYYIEAKNLRIVIPTNPPFYSEQWKNIIE